MAKQVVLVAGNICSGKTSCLRHIEEEADRFRPFLADGEKVVAVPEFIDPEALALFYANMRDNTETFELSCLHGRLVRHMKARDGDGLFFFDRGVIEGAETFGENSREEGYLSPEGHAFYQLVLNRGLAQLGLEQQDRWLEQLIVYLRVEDPRILEERVKMRNTKGENIPLDYLERINDKYDAFFAENGEVYKRYGLRAPTVLTIDASVDLRQDPGYHTRTLDRVITTMREMQDEL